MAVQQEKPGNIDYGDAKLTAGLSVFSDAFDTVYRYDGDGLGVVYTKGRTVMRLWAPTASEAYVVLYDSWKGQSFRTCEMSRREQGTWLLHLEGDWAGFYYTYKVLVGEQWNEAVDPYAKAVGVNGDRAYIGDLRAAEPDSWPSQKPPLASPHDTIIYEIHVRDATIHHESGVADRWKGKFLGLAESDTRGPDGILTGLDHIADLGVTHVQLLPVADYSTESADETAQPQSAYNWGYDPKNIQVPEGSYSTDPYDPMARIRELKQLIAACHERGLRVIIDVVYNHMYDGYRSSLAKLVPGYYFRYKKDGTLANGSGCGNDLASERPMVRKLIVDTVLHWATAYNVDGFRFDLMGLLDRQTMVDIRRRLDELDRSIIVLGEGWIMDTELPRSMCANQEQAGTLPGIAQFNDCIRDAIKGDPFEPAQPGFVNGAKELREGIMKGVAGGIPYSRSIRLFAEQPSQTINYAECHDNYTMWDKLALSSPEASEQTLARMHRLGSAIVLTSQGIPLVHAGQEFMRTKNGVENSYKSPDAINRLDWRRCAVRQEDVRYMKQLIAMRKAHPAFRLRTADEIRDSLRFEACPPHAVAYTLRDHAGGEPSTHLYVLYNAGESHATVALPALGEWRPLFGASDIEKLQDGRLTVRGICMVVLEAAN